MEAETFTELRRKVHAKCLIDLGKRLQTSALKPTTEEIKLGSFLEEIEIQIRHAVLEMNKKGYCTWSSGFYGKKSNIQGIDGPFVLDQETVAKLKKTGARIKTEKFWGKNYTSIRFKPSKPSTKLIKTTWTKLISLIPSLKHPAMLSDTYGAAVFREHYLSSRQIEILRLRGLIESKRNTRWISKWKKQLKKLKKS